MSMPCALRRWKRSAPSGLSIGITYKVSEDRIRCTAGSLRCRSKYSKTSNSAAVAVGSSPCICDHSSTRNGPVPIVTMLIERPSVDDPIRSNEIRDELRLRDGLQATLDFIVFQQRRQRRRHVFGVPGLREILWRDG